MPDAGQDSSGSNAGDNDRASRRIQRRRRAGIQRGSSLEHIVAVAAIWTTFVERLEAPARQREREAANDRAFTQFHRQQLRQEDWYPLARLVELYANALRSFRKTPEDREAHRLEAYDDLTRAILAGRMEVRFLDIATGAHRLTYEELRQRLDDQTVEEVYQGVILHCWTRYTVAGEWAAGHGLTLPARAPGPPPTAPPADTPPATAPVAELAAEPTPPPASAPDPAKTPIVPDKPRKGGLDFRESDAPLVERIVQGLTSDPPQYSNIWQACEAMEPEAKGKGSPNSKKHRLLRRYKAYSTDSSDSRSNK